MNLLNNCLNSIVGAIERLGCVVLVDKRVLLDRDLAVVASRHLRHFIFFDLFLSRRLCAFRNAISFAVLSVEVQALDVGAAQVCAPLASSLSDVERRRCIDDHL